MPRRQNSPLRQLLDRYWVNTANELLRRIRNKRRGSEAYGFHVQWAESQATASTESLAMKIRVACCPEGDYGKFLSTNKKAKHETQIEIKGKAQAVSERSLA